MRNNNPKYAFFTIDVEKFIDTECVHNTGQPVNKTMLDGLDRYIEILDKYNIKATMFVLSDLAEEIFQQLKKHLKNGHKIALHGKKHIAPLLMSDEKFREQLCEARKKLEDTFDINISGYRAPCFSIDRAKLDIIEELGFKYDSSRMDFSAARHTTRVDMDGYERRTGEIYTHGNFHEFGLSTQKFFGKNYPVSGGGYIRVSNWFFVSRLLKYYINHENYYVFYSHPFEFSREKTPHIKRLKWYDRIYLKFGHFSYPYKTENIIKKLKKAGYTFTTFEDFIEREEEHTL